MCTSVRMHLHVCVHTCVMCVSVNVYMLMSCLRAFVCACVCTLVHVCVCVSMCVYVSTYLHLCISVHAYSYMCLYLIWKTFCSEELRYWFNWGIFFCHNLIQTVIIIDMQLIIYDKK